MTAAEIAPEFSRLKRLALLEPEARQAVIERYANRAGLSAEEWVMRVRSDWHFVARPKQLPPPQPWDYWFIRAGRGFGKTLSGAQWTKERSLEWAGARVALVAPTLADVRVTMVEGETGLLSILPDLDLRGGTRDTAWNRSTCELYLANGTYLKGFSSETPNRLRGPQHHFAWCEEVSSWEDANQGDALETTFSNLKLGLRLGEHPQAVFTSTPKANKLTKDILSLDAPVLAMTLGSSYENRDNLSEVWWETVVKPYEGTRLGRQEIMAELLEDVEGALWHQAQLDALRVESAPALQRIVVAIDPNMSSAEAANDAGVIVAGRGHYDRHAYVLADDTITRGGPRAWARAAVDAYHEHNADRIVAEKNAGGEMVELTIKTVDPNVPVKLVSASRGKRTRAEPVASLYEGDPELGNPPRVHHVGFYPELEEQMCTWTPDADSPDRMDALVWALTELMLGGGGPMRVSRPKGQLPEPVRTGRREPARRA
jgi:phage terminase large subunit-like protein